MCIADHTNTRIDPVEYNSFQGWRKLPTRCNVMEFRELSPYLYSDTVTPYLLFLKPTVFIVLHNIPLTPTTYHYIPLS